MKIIDKYIIYRLNSFIERVRADGHKPTKLIIVPNPVTKDMASYLGIELEHRALYDEDGRLITICFEE